MSAYKKRFEEGQKVLIKILDNEDLKDRDEISELHEIFDD